MKTRLFRGLIALFLSANLMLLTGCSSSDNNGTEAASRSDYHFYTQEQHPNQNYGGTQSGPKVAHPTDIDGITIDPDKTLRSITCYYGKKDIVWNITFDINGFPVGTQGAWAELLDTFSPVKIPTSCMCGVYTGGARLGEIGYEYLVPEHFDYEDGDTFSFSTTGDMDKYTISIVKNGSPYCTCAVRNHELKEIQFQYGEYRYQRGSNKLFIYDSDGEKPNILEYDDKGNIVSLTTYYRGTKYPMQYSYSETGKLLSIEYTDYNAVRHLRSFEYITGTDRIRKQTYQTESSDGIYTDIDRSGYYQWEYDNEGRVTSILLYDIEDQLRVSEEYTYDGDSIRHTITDSDGKRIYDENDQLLYEECYKWIGNQPYVDYSKTYTYGKQIEITTTEYTYETNSDESIVNQLDSDTHSSSKTNLFYEGNPQFYFLVDYYTEEEMEQIREEMEQIRHDNEFHVVE